MSDAVIVEPRAAHKPVAERRKPAARKAQYTHRITFCLAEDQVRTLELVKQALRASEAYVFRMSFDTFCRANGFTPLNNGGPTNVR
jgi:hypothetical protein